MIFASGMYRIFSGQEALRNRESGWCGTIEMRSYGYKIEDYVDYWRGIFALAKGKVLYGWHRLASVAMKTKSDDCQEGRIHGHPGYAASYNSLIDITSKSGLSSNSSVHCPYTKGS
jgi:hypothetical protein